MLYNILFFRIESDYILSLRQPTFSRWTAHPYWIHSSWCLAADHLFPFVHLFRFYYTPSRYLGHKMYYYSYLVEITLRYSRNLMVYSRRFTSTRRPKKVSHTFPIKLCLHQLQKWLFIIFYYRNINLYKVDLYACCFLAYFSRSMQEKQASWH